MQMPAHSQYFSSAFPSSLCAFVSLREVSDSLLEFLCASVFSFDFKIGGW